MTLYSMGVFFLIVRYSFPVICGKAIDFWGEETKILKGLDKLLLMVRVKQETKENLKKA